MAKEAAMVFRPSVRQWNEFLGAMPKNKRAAYVRSVIDQFIKETPTLHAIPLHEPPDEPITIKTIQLINPTPEVQAWFGVLPEQMRSYVIRYMLNWHRKHYPPEGAPIQTTLDMEDRPLQPTGT